jgi:hypothetical protein
LKIILSIQNGEEPKSITGESAIDVLLEVQIPEKLLFYLLKQKGKPRKTYKARKI